MKHHKYRIKETEKGFITQYKEYGIFNHVWRPFITWSGLDTAYPYSSRMNAENALLMEIKKQYILHE